MNQLSLNWLKAAGVRALKTFAQTMLSMITIGAAWDQINWMNALSVAGVAALYSILTSFATKLPELEEKTAEQ